MEKGDLKRVAAALLLIVSALALMQATKDRFVQLFIVAAILFSMIFRRQHLLKKRDRLLRAERELEMEEEGPAVEEEKKEGSSVQENSVTHEK